MIPESRNTSPEFQLSAQERSEHTFGQLEKNIHSKNETLAVQAVIDAWKIKEDLKILQNPAGITLTFEQLGKVTQEAIYPYIEQAVKVSDKFQNIDINNLTVDQVSELFEEVSRFGRIFAFGPILNEYIEKGEKLFALPVTRQIVEKHPEISDVLSKQSSLNDETLGFIKDLKQKSSQNLPHV